MLLISYQSSSSSSVSALASHSSSSDKDAGEGSGGSAQVGAGQSGALRSSLRLMAYARSTAVADSSSDDFLTCGVADEERVLSDRGDPGALRSLVAGELGGERAWSQKAHTLVAGVDVSKRYGSSLSDEEA